MATAGGRGAASAPGHIYIIQEGNNKAFKVGSSPANTGNYRPFTVKDKYPVYNVSAAKEAAYANLNLRGMASEEGGGKGWFRGEYETIRDLVYEACKRFLSRLVKEVPDPDIRGGGFGVRPNAPGYIYIIQEGKHNVKVGATKYEDVVNKRLKEIQPGNYRKLTFKYKYKVNNMSAAEDDAHNILSGMARQLPGGGTEWFKGKYPYIRRQVRKAIGDYLVE